LTFATDKLETFSRRFLSGECPSLARAERNTVKLTGRRPMTRRSGLHEVDTQDRKLRVHDALALVAPAEQPKKADATLAEIASQIRDSRDQPVSPTLQGIVERVRLLTQAEGAAIAVLDEWGVVCRASSGNAPPLGSRLRPDSGLTRECFERGEVVTCDDAENDPRVEAAIAKSLHLRSAAAVPIVAGEKVLGLIEILSSRPRNFGLTDVARLQMISRQLAPLLGASALPRRQAKASPRWLYISSAVLALILVLGLSVGEFYRARRKLAAPTAYSPTLDQRQGRVSQPETRGEAAEGLKRADHPRPAEAPPPAPVEREKPERAVRADRLPASQPGNTTVAAIVVPSNPARTAAPLTAEPPLVAQPPAPQILGEMAKAPGLNVPVPASPALIPTKPFASEFGLDHTVKAHSGWITSVAFSPDGRRLASGGWEQAVELWDVATGQELGALGGKMKEIQAIAFTPDGRSLAMENSADTVALWDTASGREIRKFQSEKPLGVLGNNWVYSIAFSPDSHWLASGIDDKTIRLWDVQSGGRIRDVAGSRRPVLYAAFSPDGRFLASGVDERTIGIWEAATGRQVRKLSGHKKPIYAVRFSPDGQRLASASADRTIKLWDVQSGRELATLVGHGNVVTSLAFSGDGRWLASGSWDKTIRIWNVETARESQILNGHTHNIYSVAFDPSSKWLASGSEDGTIRLWRLGRSAD
jgi:hypothetical protein